MAVLVTLLGVVLALLTVLVGGLLRSHAEILRALHDLGVDLDAQRAGAGAATSIRNAPVVRAREVPRRPTRSASDVVGVTPDHDAVSIAVVGARDLTLLAFLSSGCGTCFEFWDALGRGRDVTVPGDARLVIVTKDPSDESVTSVRRLADTPFPVVMSTAAWDAYDVPVAPFFVLVDGQTGAVVGEGAASNWDQVVSLLRNALGDAGMLDRHGRPKRGARPRARTEAEREARVDHDLLAAGIQPGDPSLYTLPTDNRVEKSDGE